MTDLSGGPSVDQLADLARTQMHALPAVPGYRYDEAGIAEALFNHFSQLGYAVLREVAALPALQGGRWVTRRADAIALGGPGKFDAIAFEIKVTRQDFAADVRNPDKQAPWVRTAAAHFFVAPRGLLDPAEIPDYSGLIEVERVMHPIGKTLNRVTFALTNRGTLDVDAVVPDWLLRDITLRAATAEARLAGWFTDVPPLEQLQGELARTTTALEVARAQGARATEVSAAWKALAAAQGHKVPCADCGAAVHPVRVSAGALAGWRHTQPHLTTDCPGNATGIHPREETP